MFIISLSQFLYWLGFQSIAMDYYYINLGGDETKLALMSGIKHHIVLYFSIFMQWLLFKTFHNSFQQKYNSPLLLFPIVKYPGIVLLFSIGLNLLLYLVGELIEVKILTDTVYEIFLFIAILATGGAFVYGIYKSLKANNTTVTSPLKGVLYTLLLWFYFSAMILGFIFAFVGLLKIVLIILGIAITILFVKGWIKPRYYIVED